MVVQDSSNHKLLRWLNVSEDTFIFSELQNKDANEFQTEISGSFLKLLHQPGIRICLDNRHKNRIFAFTWILFHLLNHIPHVNESPWCSKDVDHGGINMTIVVVIGVPGFESLPIVIIFLSASNCNYNFFISKKVINITGT